MGGRYFVGRASCRVTNDIAGTDLPPLQFPSRTGPPQPQHDRNPPLGLFRWHYLQCVIKNFAHADYINLQNIAYYELPFRMEGDSDDDGTDSLQQMRAFGYFGPRASHAGSERAPRRASETCCRMAHCSVVVIIFLCNSKA